MASQRAADGKAGAMEIQEARSRNVWIEEEKEWHFLVN